MKKEFDISFPSILPSRSKDDRFHAGQGGFGRRLPESPLKSGFGHKIVAGTWALRGPPYGRSAELSLPYVTQAHCSLTLWGKYQMTIFKGSGGFNYSYDKITFRFK